MNNYRVVDKCGNCMMYGCSIFDHRDLVVTAADGKTEIVKGECKACKNCDGFVVMMCCGTARCCNWGGKGPPDPPADEMHLQRLYERHEARRDGFAAFGARGFGPESAMDDVRREMLRRGMRDPQRR